ncbi:MAG: hypothetical protein JWM91_2782 [Rhodospirillales bacterium]|nr:hypothetical protein [Rhodospirillales bacterium]
MACLSTAMSRSILYQPLLSLVKRQPVFNNCASITSINGRRPTKGCGPAVAPTCAFAFENVRDYVPYLTMEPGDPHNVHVHWAVHVPPARMFDFGNQVWNWVRLTAGEITGGAETIKITDIPDLKALRGYFVKESKVAARFGGIHRPQGIIIGRRSGTTRNIGPTARRNSDKARGIRRRIPSCQVALHPPQ